MRRINKSTNIPVTLQTAPIPNSAGDVREYIYKADDVRSQLMADQYNKCAYCECNITKRYNDVEHYRPKSTYFWLGHEWDNLLYSCDLCNRTYKNTQFPLDNEAARVSSPGSVSGESPLIINPTKVDPSSHIKFNRYMMVPLTKEGQKTIEIFHLNDRNERPELIDGREQLFDKYKDELIKIASAQKILKYPGLPQSAIDEANKIIALCNITINKYKSPSEAYSGMLIAQI